MTMFITITDTDGNRHAVYLVGLRVEERSRGGVNIHLPNDRIISSHEKFDAVVAKIAQATNDRPS